MIILGVGITVFIVVAVGIYVGKKIDGDSVNFLVAGRKLGIPFVASTLIASAVDTNATVGNADLSAQFGFWAGASLGIGMGIALFLNGLFFARRLNKMQLFTLADFYAKRFGRGMEVTSSVFMLFSYALLMAGNLVACGLLLHQFMGIPYVLGVIISVLLVLVYTIVGGMFSDAYTGTIQICITFVASVVLLFFVMGTTGFHWESGFGPFDWAQLSDPKAGSTINWATLVALGLGNLTAIDFAQRINSAKSPDAAQKANFIAAGGTAAIGVLYGLVSLAAVAAFHLKVDDGPILFQFLQHHTPAWLNILVLSGIVAASFSTASGAILATATTGVRNIVGIRRVITSGHDPLLRWTRIAMIPMVILGTFVAIVVSQTGILLTLAFDLMLAGLVIPYVFGLFWKRGGKHAAFLSLILGVSVRLVLFVLTPTIYGVPNDVLYIPNHLLTADFDGWPTFIAAAVSLVAYVIGAMIWPDDGKDALEIHDTDNSTATAAKDDLAAAVTSATAIQTPSVPTITASPEE